MSELNATVDVVSEFTNDVVDCHQITTEDLPLTSLSPKYRQINLIWAVCFGLILAAMLALISSSLFFPLPEKLQPFVNLAYGAIIVITLWSFIYHYFADPLKQYALREHDLNYQSGLIFRSMLSQPILRIQHIEIKRGPIERKAGLATLQVFSAGGVSHTFNIPGLEHDKAISLRQFILDHKDLAADV